MSGEAGQQGASPLWWAGYRAGVRDIARVLGTAAHPSDLARVGGTMSALLGHWSGAQARALRLARRMSVRQFAAHLGVSDRQITSKFVSANPVSY